MGKYAWDKARRCLTFAGANGQASATPPKNSSAPAPAKSKSPAAASPSKSPAEASPAKSPAPIEQPDTFMSGRGGSEDDDDGPAEREETDSGFAQHDLVMHTKRGKG